MKAQTMNQMYRQRLTNVTK